MSKFTVKKSDNFTILPNNILKNKDMSLKAIGLLCKMLSLPEDWDYSVEGLCRICKEGQTAIIHPKVSLSFVDRNASMGFETCFSVGLYNLKIFGGDTEPS